MSLTLLVLMAPWVISNSWMSISKAWILWPC